MIKADNASVECLSSLVGEGYKRLAARCVTQVDEWHQGIKPLLASFLRNISQDRSHLQQPATAPVASTAFYGIRSQTLLENVVDLGLLTIFNKDFKATMDSLEKVAQSGDILPLDGSVLSQFMRYIDAGVVTKPDGVIAKPYDKAGLWKLCTSLTAAHFFPSFQDPSQELFSRLKVKNVAFVSDFSRIEWNNESQERTLPIPYDANKCMMYNVVFGVRLIYGICQLELGVQNLEEAHVKKSLQMVGAGLGLEPGELKAELDVHSEAVLSAVYMAQPHFGAEGIFRKAPQFQEVDRRSYVLMSVLDTLLSARTAAIRSASVTHPEAGHERLYVYGVGLAELLHNSPPSSLR